MVLSGATVDSDGDSIAKFNGEYKLSTKVANGYPVYEQRRPKSYPTNYIYRAVNGVWMVCDTISEMKTNEGDIVSMKPGDQPTGLTWDEVGVSVNQWAPKESETQAASATGDIKAQPPLEQGNDIDKGVTDTGVMAEESLRQQLAQKNAELAQQAAENTQQAAELAELRAELKQRPIKNTTLLERKEADAKRKSLIRDSASADSTVIPNHRKRAGAATGSFDEVL